MKIQVTKVTKESITKKPLLKQWLSVIINLVKSLFQHKLTHNINTYKQNGNTPLYL